MAGSIPAPRYLLDRAGRIPAPLEEGNAVANMSYCRFRNTLSDLRACADALLDGPPEDADEFRAAERMRHICQDFLDAADCLDDFRACGKGCGQVIGLREVCDCGEDD